MRWKCVQLFAPWSGNSSIILIEPLVRPMFLCSDLSRQSSNLSRRIVSFSATKTQHSSEELKQNDYLVILRHVQKDLLSLVFIFDDSGIKALPAKSSLWSLIITEIKARIFVLTFLVNIHLGLMHQIPDWLIYCICMYVCILNWPHPIEAYSISHTENG